MKCAALVFALLLSGSEARADPSAGHWQADLDLSARYAGNVDTGNEGGPGRLHQGTGRADLRGLAGAYHVGFAGGLDVELGFEVPGGFVYGFHLLPVGVGVRLWDRAAIGVMSGAGIGGVVDRLPFAWELPVHAFLELDLGAHARLLGSARATWTPGTSEREAGAVDAGWTDEAELGVGVAFGARHRSYRVMWSDGTYVGVAVREQAGARLYGIVLSVNLNGASAGARD